MLSQHSRMTSCTLGPAPMMSCFSSRVLRAARILKFMAWSIVSYEVTSRGIV
jgi:hypothetical protein